MDISRRARGGGLRAQGGRGREMEVEGGEGAGGRRRDEGGGSPM